MKKVHFILFCLSSILLFSSFKNLRISKEDLIQQSKQPIFKEMIICYNDAGEKFWLNRFSNDLLTVRLIKSKTKKILQFNSIVIDDGKITGITQGAWDARKLSFQLNDIDYFEIQSNSPPIPFYDVDSINKLVAHKNDSLAKNIKNHAPIWVFVSAKDSLRLVVGCCYNLEFADGTITKYGVIKKLTEDSIFLSNAFSVDVAQFEKQTFQELSYTKKDLVKIIVLKRNSYTVQKHLVNQCKHYTETNANEKPRYFYSLDKKRGIIKLHRFWLTDEGFIMVFEEGGKVFWSNG